MLKAIKGRGNMYPSNKPNIWPAETPNTCPLRSESTEEKQESLPKNIFYLDRLIFVLGRRGTRYMESMLLCLGMCELENWTNI